MDEQLIEGRTWGRSVFCLALLGALVILATEDRECLAGDRGELFLADGLELEEIYFDETTSPAELAKEIYFMVALARHENTIFASGKGSGKIFVFENDVLLPEPLIDLDVAHQNERGLLGLALHPDYPSTPYLYAYYSASPLEGEDDNRPNEQFPGNRLVRLELKENQAINVETLLELPGNTLGYHYAGSIRFDRQGLLWLSVGDNLGHLVAPQNLGSRYGKMLRLDEDGNPASGNPFALDEDEETLPEIFSYGHRNPFNFTFHPILDTVYSTENGALIEDEINVIEAGMNYGWAEVEGPADTEEEILFAQGNTNYRDPIWSTGPTTTCPSGIVIARGELGLNRHLIWCECKRPGKIWMVPLTGENDEQIDGEPELLAQGVGRCTDLEWDEDGSLLIAHWKGVSRIRRIVVTDSGNPSLILLALGMMALFLLGRRRSRRSRVF